MLRARSQKSDRDPRYERHQQQPDQKREQIAGDRLQSFVRMHPADRASRVVAHAERWSKQAYAHRKDDNHRVVDFMHADLPGDRKQKRTEQHDGGNPLENAAEHHKRGDRNQEKGRHAAGQPCHRFG